MPREDLLTRTLVELADNLVADFDVVEFLTFLSQRTVELVAARAAGIVLADPGGNLRYMASSGEEARLLELFELQYDEGPCLDSFRTGEPVVNEDLTAPSPWPRFAPVAVEAGFRSVYAMPMRLRETVIGSLNIFGSDVVLPEADLLIAQALADVATISIVQERAMSDAHELSEQLGYALNSRVVIEQAKGMLAERCQIDMDEAFTRLRRYSRATSSRLSGVAHDIIDGSLSADDLTRTAEVA